MISSEGSMIFIVAYGGNLSIYQLLNDENTINSSFGQNIGVININKGEEDELDEKIVWWDKTYKQD